MTPVRALIVDDEALARERVRTLLADRDDIEVLEECANGEDAVEAIRSLEPDLVFLDVQMPGLDGMGVIDAIGPDAMPATVFVTAFDEFALRAFEVHALDYLLKPFDRERFDTTLDRARQHLRRPGEFELDQRLTALLERVQTRSDRYLERLAVRGREDRLIMLRTEEIEWIEAAGNYAKLHVWEKTYSIRQTMQELESRLDPHRFARIHRSTIVNIDRISQFEPLYQGDYLIVMQSGKRLTSSRSYRDNVRQMMGDV